MPIRRQWRTCVAAAMLLVSAPAVAERPESSEAAVKAAFLYNFTKFVEWPGSAFPQPSAAFVVCAFADGAFRKELENILQSEQVRGRPIAIAPASLERSARLSHRLLRARRCRAAGKDPRRPEAIAGADGRRRPPLPRTGRADRVHARERSRPFRDQPARRGRGGIEHQLKLLRVAREFEGRTQP